MNKKSRTTPELVQKTKIMIEGSIENISFLALLFDPETVFETYPGPKNCPFIRGQDNPKIKHFLNLTLIHKGAYLCPKRPNKN